LGNRGVQLEASKLFAMVVVRNLYPEAFADLIKRRGAIYSVINGFSEWRAEQVREIEGQIEYVQVRQANRENGLLEQEIESLKSESVITKRMPFRVAAKQKYGEVLTQKLGRLEAVTDLMQTGFFDTDYNDYLSFFYEGALTQDDKNLILALRRGESPPVMVVVNDPARVLGKLEHQTLEEGRGFISGLVEYLCSQYSTADDGPHAGKLATILSTAPEFMERFADTVDSILPSTHAHALIQAIYHYEPMLLETLVLHVQSGPRQALLCAIFSSLTHEQADVLDGGDSGVLYSVQGLPDVSDLVPLLAQGKDAWKWLHEQPVQFHNLSDTTSADDLRQLVSLGFVVPQLDMLSLICTTFDAKAGHETPVTYRRLLGLQLDGIEKLLAHSPATLVKALLGQQCPLDESAESLTVLLTAIGGESEWARSLLERTDCHFATLENVPTAAWGRLLDADRVTEKAQAAWAYFPSVPRRNGRPLLFGKGDALARKPKSEILNGFLERNVVALADTLWTLHPDQHGDLQRYLLREQEISNDTLARLLSTTTLKSIDILNSVPQTRWEMLAAADFLPYTDEISNIVKDNASAQEADRFEQRNPIFNATNSNTTPQIPTPGAIDP
jgi:hypothetical protein